MQGLAAQPDPEDDLPRRRPGHQASVRAPDGQEWLVYHAWPPDAIGASTPGRQLWIDRLEWRNGAPVVEGPTCGPQRAPS